MSAAGSADGGSSGVPPDSATPDAAAAPDSPASTASDPVPPADPGSVFGPLAQGGSPRAGGPPGGSTVLRPEDADRFTRRLDDLEQSVAEARDALRSLAETPLALGSGQDNALMGAWYRDLLADDAAPAADDLARELDAVRRTVRESVAEWEHTDRGAAAGFSSDPPPS